MFKECPEKRTIFAVIFCVWLAILFLWLSPPQLWAQTDTAPHRTEESDTVPDGTEGEVLVKKNAPKRPWNEFDLGFTTFKFGAGFLYQYGWF